MNIEERRAWNEGVRLHYLDSKRDGNSSLTLQWTLEFRQSKWAF